MSSKNYENHQQTDVVRQTQLLGQLTTVDTTAVTVLERDSNEDVSRAKGATVPTNAESGFAVGCRFIDTDGGVGTTLYINEGSNVSCDFNAK